MADDYEDDDRDLTIPDMITLLGEHGSETYGRDNYGEYGSIFLEDWELQVPEPDNDEANEERAEAMLQGNRSDEEYENEVREILKPEGFAAWKQKRDLRRAGAKKRVAEKDDSSERIE
jgi:hypothetical protein